MDDPIGAGTTTVAVHDGGTLVPIALRPPGLGLGVPLVESPDGPNTSFHYLTALPVGGEVTPGDHADGAAGFGPHHGGSVIGLPHPHVHYPPNYVPFVQHAAACEDAGACPRHDLLPSRVVPVSPTAAPPAVTTLALPHVRVAVSHSLSPDEARRAHLPGAAADMQARKRKREAEILTAAAREAVVMGRPAPAARRADAPWWADDPQLAAEASVLHGGCSTQGAASWGNGWGTFGPDGVPLTAEANRTWGMPSGTVWEPFAFHRARARCSRLCRQHPALPGMCEDARCGAQCMMAVAFHNAL